MVLLCNHFQFYRLARLYIKPLPMHGSYSLHFSVRAILVTVPKKHNTSEPEKSLMWLGYLKTVLVIDNRLLWMLYIQL
jgi:hypothetical protein